MIRVRRRHKRGEAQADLTSILDIVFNLLIFFMLTATVAPEGMDVNLPEAKSSTTQEDTSKVISITENNQLYFNKEPISVEQLAGKLASLSQDAPIVIQGDKAITYGLFVKVMDEVRSHGNHKIVLSSEAESEKKSEK